MNKNGPIVVIEDDQEDQELLVEIFKGLGYANTVIYFQASELIVKNLDEAPLHIDGEPRETAGVFHFKILKDCFELMQP